MDQEIYTRLKAAFQGVVFSEALDRAFAPLWSLKSFKRGDFLTEAGEVERHFYYVLEGVQTIYLINAKGEKVVLGFSYTGNFSGVYDSFLTRKPSHYFLEALSSTKVLTLSIDAYEQLFETDPQFDRWNRIFLQHVLIGRVNREVELLTLPARDRYLRFMKRCPEPLFQIPQKYLASYLNMKPETFSRLRATVKW